VRKPDRRPTVPATALIPLRLFLGVTFVIAGFDKLLDPRFFDPTSPASIQAQMLAFSRVSPIGGLVAFGQPLAVPIGLGIAFAEIAAGLGALTGLAFKPAATLGAGLSLLFFLTASWATRPFYYGADLPFAAGWLTLALAGHGDIWVARRLLDWASGPPPPEARRGKRSPAADAPSVERRAVLQSGALAMLALLAASLAVPLRAAGIVTPDANGTGERAPNEATGGAGSSVGDSSGQPLRSTPVPSGGAVSGALKVASIATVAETGAASFTVPFTAPAPLPAGDPGVIVKLADGSYVAFDAVCTHAGCTVEWDQTDGVLVCPCHDAAFDPANGAAVLQGPANEPLPTIPIVVDPASGAIYLRA
jgi:thiosulfate dehydrogenase [quinone] large subunit